MHDGLDKVDKKNKMEDSHSDGSSIDLPVTKAKKKKFVSLDDEDLSDTSFHHDNNSSPGSDSDSKDDNVFLQVNQQNKKKKSPISDKTKKITTSKQTPKTTSTKTISEKLDSVRERCKEPNHTKLMSTTESSYKSRQLAQSRGHLKPGNTRPNPSTPNHVVTVKDRKSSRL